MSFDVSSVCTGWSYFEDGKLREFGKIEMPKKHSLQNKLWWFKSQTDALLMIYKPNKVIVEETYLKNVKTLKTLMQFITVVNMSCYKLGIEPVFIYTVTVRSKFGLKTKEEVFEFVKDKYKKLLKKYEFDDGNDITDSILMGLYFLEKEK
jgi:Holliday junction resolvasome RuvABC endonuclease subunit